MAKPTGYKLDHRIIIQYDASNGTSDRPDWQPLFVSPIYAQKEGLSEKNFFASGADQSKENSTFVIHFSPSYYSKIRGSMQLIDKGDAERPFEILGAPIDIFDDRRWLKIHAQRNDLNGG